jgi:hypothetical protein
MVLLTGRISANVTAVGQFQSVESLMNEQFSLDEESGRTMVTKMKHLLLLLFVS